MSKLTINKDQLTIIKSLDHFEHVGVARVLNNREGGNLV